MVVRDERDGEDRMLFRAHLLAIFLASMIFTIVSLNAALQIPLGVNHQYPASIQLQGPEPTSSSDSGLKNQEQSGYNLHDAPFLSSFRNHNEIEQDYQVELENLNSKIRRLHPPLNQSRPIKLTQQICKHKTVPERFPNLTSSIEFVGCCGLGHRLARMANAAHLSYSLRIPLFGWWGCCGQEKVFDNLFGPEALNIIKPFDRPSDDPQHYQVRFDVIGHIFGIIRRYTGMQKRRNHISCPIRKRKVESDYKLYALLRERYTRKHQVDAFVREHFGEGDARKFVVGMHIRAGNGEKGDFQAKLRFVKNKAVFVETLVRHLTTIFKQSKKPPVLFIATDTPSYIPTLRDALGKKVTVVDLPQTRVEEGKGVMFGEMSNVKNKGHDCMEGWFGALSDMFIISHADVVFAPKLSAFSHTLPLSLVAWRSNKEVKASFCEGGKSGELWCFESVEEWSCKTVSGQTSLFDVYPQYTFL